MKYANVAEGVFILRPNRFTAQVVINGNIETVHVKNTGRCKELLTPGARVFLALSDNPARKTKYDLICAEKKCYGKTLLINIDSQAPNDIAEEWLRKNMIFGRDAVIFRERFYKTSRFDFYIETPKRKIFLEVKGCTLERNGFASFPDAPTARGRKHLCELTECIRDGYEAYIIFIIQMQGMRAFSPNEQNDKAFSEAFRHALSHGVRSFAVECSVTPDTVTPLYYVPIKP